ncbi:conserved hypothetical protein [Desulfamplus magnetovallimortis]|uniref:SHSP domain-containing protein n=1 Tax=Desulfamplus magnetovallimortis TaxID=1246637 RepID=A0A1W1HIH1_9BACT|nr:Hsp20/alpha crystallin family protein [Desulfamplus magnetovallimortis]SLM32233.1 conserved hypothetical protein [Desulfamplus magnetovallimortis]
MITRRMLNFPAATGWSHPFFGMDELRKDMDRLNRLFDSSGSSYLPHFFKAGVFPALNITENEEKYFVRAELPGIKAEELDIQVNGRNLTISGERNTACCEENIKYHRREREGGKFSRGIVLPGDVDPEKVTASMVNGLLTVTAGKSEAAKPRKINVN